MSQVKDFILATGSFIGNIIFIVFSRIAFFSFISLIIVTCQKGCEAISNGINPSPILYSSISTFTDSELNEYKTTVLGDQEWLAGNLEVTKFRDGSRIPQAKNITEWIRYYQQQQPAWAYINFDSTEGHSYGKLYNWFAVIHPGGLAPAGWEIPATHDWLKLAKSTQISYSILQDEKNHFFEGQNDSRVLQSDKEDFDLPGHTWWFDTSSGFNTSGFDALPGGWLPEEAVNQKKESQTLGSVTGWWGCDGFSVNAGSHLTDDTRDNEVHFWSRSPVASGLYVRCVRTVSK